ncbi:MAG TPA: thioredoxin domain-containing protein, partial [Terriglobia bacterium]|nr:thioredoxin domain-containing protein [Terriglobia bacterium]
VVLCMLVTIDIAVQLIHLASVRARSAKEQAAVEGVREVFSSTTFDLANLPTQGSPSAQLVLVEFSDFECPFCRRHATTVLEQLQSRFVKTGKLRYAFANNPLPQHANAKLLAIASVCAAKQDHFWEMHGVIFTKQPKTRRSITGHLQELDVNPQRFEECLDSSEPLQQVERDTKTATELGPSFALGRVDPRGTVSVERLIVGSQSIEVFEKAINDVLSN